MSESARVAYEFGPFRLEPDEARLTRGGEPIHVTPKALELLTALVTRQGSLVSKETLLAELWKGTFVEEGNLAVNATALRKALGDDAGSPYFETVPRKGYRFVAPVRAVTIARTAMPVTVVTEAPTPPGAAAESAASVPLSKAPPTIRLRLIAAAASALGVLAAVGYVGRRAGPAAGEGVPSRLSTSKEAYELYVKGRERWSRGTLEATRAAIQLYRDAIERDAGFAGAYAGLADAYASDSAGMPPKQRLPLARAAAARAVELSPGLAEAHVALAHVSYRLERNWPLAERELRRALALDPNSGLAHHHLGTLRLLFGRWLESLEASRRAHELDAHAPQTHVQLAIALRILDRLPEARAIVEEGLRRDEHNPAIHEAHAEVLEAEARERESIAEHLEALLLSGTPFSDVDRLREAYRVGGRPAYLRAHNQLLLARLEDETGSALVGTRSTLASNFARLRDADQTLRWLEAALERDEGGPLYLNLPQYAFLRGDPRFQAFHKLIFGASSPASP